jgi:hypothetical protein
LPKDQHIAGIAAEVGDGAVRDPDGILEIPMGSLLPGASSGRDKQRDAQRHQYPDSDRRRDGDAGRCRPGRRPARPPESRNRRTPPPPRAPRLNSQHRSSNFRWN